MPTDPQEFARLLGAEIVGEVPDVVGGPVGMARLAQIMQKCLSQATASGAGRTGQRRKKGMRKKSRHRG